MSRRFEPKCRTCRNEEAAAALDEIVASVDRLAEAAQANPISLESVYDRLLQVLPGYPLGIDAMKAHLRKHRRGAYNRLWRLR